MSLMPEIERELRRAARRLSAHDPEHDDERATPVRRHHPLRARELALTAGLVAVVAVVAGTLLLTLRHADSAQRAATPKPLAPRQLIRVRWPARPTCSPVVPRADLPPRVGCVGVFAAPIAGAAEDRVLLYTGLSRDHSLPGGYPPSYYGLTVLDPLGEVIGRIRLPGRRTPRLVSVANVNDRPGDELFVQGDGARDDVSVYSFDGHRLVRATPRMLSFGRGPGTLAEYACLATSPPAVVQQTFLLNPRLGWVRSDTEYEWVGARLRLAGQTRSQVRGAPRRATASGC